MAPLDIAGILSEHVTELGATARGGGGGVKDEDTMKLREL